MLIKEAGKKLFLVISVFKATIFMGMVALPISPFGLFGVSSKLIVYSSKANRERQIALNYCEMETVCTCCECGVVCVRARCGVCFCT